LEAQKDRGAVAVKEKQYKDARATAWQVAKDTHLHEVVRWEEAGQSGPKLKQPKQMFGGSMMSFRGHMML